MQPTQQILSSYRFGPYSWVLFLAMGAALLVALILWHRRSVPSAQYLISLELAAALWAFAIAFEGAATTVPRKLLWSQIAYLGTTTVPLSFLLFATSYGGGSSQLAWRHIALLSIVPALTVIVAATNSLHHWLWPDIVINPATGLAIYAHGWWFWLHVAYAYAMVSVGVASLVTTTIRAGRFYQTRAGAILAGAALPIVGNLIYVLDLNPLPGVDWTPVSFVLSGSVLAWAIQRFRIFDLLPIARSRLVDTMPDGLLVIDRQGRIADLNAAMEAIVGAEGQQVIGQPARQVLEQWRGFFEQLRADKETDLEICVDQGERQAHYDLRISPIRSRAGQVGGWLVVLRDITTRTHLEQERTRLVDELQDALAQVKTLSGLLPMCASCKRIRDDQGYWHSVEAYLATHSDAELSHGICPECMNKLYSDYSFEQR
jgi:PAS domain S-box-containing protein